MARPMLQYFEKLPKRILEFECVGIVAGITVQGDYTKKTKQK